MKPLVARGENMFGNERTGETICITYDGIRYTMMQVQKPGGGQAQNVLYRTTSHRNMREYWDVYKVTDGHTGKWTKLKRYFAEAPPMQMEMPIDPQPNPNPYTHTSGIS